MNHRKIFGGVVALLLAINAVPASAQIEGRWAWNVMYSPVLSTGATSDFADGFSWRGATIDVERGLSANATVGLSVGWHVLDDKDAGTAFFPGGAISGTAYRYVNAVPILATGSLYMGQRRSSVRPYVSAGAGTYYVKNRTEAGVFAVEDSNWHLGLMGEAGLIFPRPGGTTLTMGARYNWAMETDGIERPYFTFSIGYMVGN